MVSMIMLSAAACTEEPNNEGGSSEVRVESILIQPDELTLKAGETGVFTYEITPADAANETFKNSLLFPIVNRLSNCFF